MELPRSLTVRNIYAVYLLLWHELLMDFCVHFANIPQVCFIGNGDGNGNWHYHPLSADSQKIKTCPNPLKIMVPSDMHAKFGGADSPRNKKNWGQCNSLWSLVMMRILVFP